MSEKKEPLEIDCASCEARFRLWIPLSEMARWESGSNINCIRCGAPYLVTKTPEGFVVKAAPVDRAHFDTGALAIDANDGSGPRVLDGSPLDIETASEAGPADLPVEEDLSVISLPTVLVVEDDALSRKMVENTLEDGERKLILVKNGAEALQILRDEHVDLLVVDLYLKNPDDAASLIDGEELLQEVLRMELEIPAIVTTGKELVDDISLDPKWFNFHVKDFIQKGNPFWVDELKVKVSDIIAKR